MFAPRPAVEKELNQTLEELHLFVRGKLFPEITVPGSIGYDSGLDAHKVRATISGSYAGEHIAACVILNHPGGHLASYAIHIGPGSALAGARTMVRCVAHELAHVARYLELFRNHPSTPTALLVAWYRFRKYVTREERKVEELCKARGLESFLNGRWPA